MKMKKKVVTISFLVVAALSFTTTSCGASQPHHHAAKSQQQTATTSVVSPTAPAPQIPTELLPIVETWERDTGLPMNVDIRFTAKLLDGGNAIAACFFHGNLILINRTSWNKYSPEIHEETIYHELGHCAIGLMHDNRRENNRPASIMNSIVLDAKDYVPNREEYIEEYLGKINQLLYGGK